MGMFGIGIDEPDNIKSGLKNAFMYKDPILVLIQTDPNALAMPPKLEFDQLKGFALLINIIKIYKSWENLRLLKE